MAARIRRLVIPQEDDHPDYAYDERSDMVVPGGLATDDELANEENKIRSTRSYRPSSAGWLSLPQRPPCVATDGRYDNLKNGSHQQRP